MHHLKQNQKPVARQIENSTHVDNFITGVQTNEAGNEFYYESKALFWSAGMNLREFASNDLNFMTSLPDSDKVKGNVIKVLTDDLQTCNPEEFLCSLRPNGIYDANQRSGQNPTLESR